MLTLEICHLLLLPAGLNSPAIHNHVWGYAVQHIEDNPVRQHSRKQARSLHGCYLRSPGADCIGQPSYCHVSQTPHAHARVHVHAASCTARLQTTAAF